MKIVAVIPARYNSTRFPGKPLADICGKPMIWWVYNQVKKVKEINEVYVATDDERIEKVCTDYNFNVVMTSVDNETSTTRVQEVSNKVKADLYLVINGDEPLIDPNVIRKIIPHEEINNNDIYVANLMTKITDPVQMLDFTNIKVVTDVNNNAMFFSRSPIPYPKNSLDYSFYKHVGVLIYNKKALDFFKNTKKGKIEMIEDVNEIRFLENGAKIKMVEVESESLSVDTPKDLIKIRELINEKEN